MIDITQSNITEVLSKLFYINSGNIYLVPDIFGSEPLIECLDENRLQDVILTDSTNQFSFYINYDYQVIMFELWNYNLFNIPDSFLSLLFEYNIFINFSPNDTDKLSFIDSKKREWTINNIING